MSSKDPPSTCYNPAMTEEIPQEIPLDEEQTKDVVSFKRWQLYSLLIPLTFVTGLAAGYLFWGRSAAGTAGQQLAASGNQSNQGGSPLNQIPAQFEVSLDDDPSLGPLDAPITIVEFSDFNCPYCQVFHQETFQALLETFPGQIHFVYRDFPVVGGFVAAQAAECADEQGAFWAYHDLLFSGRLPLDLTAFAQYAEELGLDSEALIECVESERFADEVIADASYASGLGLNGTPSFFINGFPVIGARPLDYFVSVIEQQLDS